MSESGFFQRLRLSHRAGDSWHPLIEMPSVEEPPEEAAQSSRGRVFRCDECDLEIIAIGELWQEGTMDW